MPVTALKKRSQVDNDPQGQKLIKSVLDIINPPADQPTEKETAPGEQLNRGNTPEKISKIVLYIDDDSDDRLFVREAIESIDQSFILHEAQSGQDGLAYLTKAKSMGSLPCLIILDHNMPGMNGFDTYNEIKKDDTLRAIPSVIFTTSAVFNGANKGNTHLPVFIKPCTKSDVVTTIKKILTYCKD
jgi:CheY-like chemotaxis protein